MLQINVADVRTRFIIHHGGVPPGPVVPTVVYSRERYGHVRRIFRFAISLAKHADLSREIQRLRRTC